MTSVLDLHVGHRKVAGASLQALASMCGCCRCHLREVAGGSSSMGSIERAQRKHASSGSVSRHAVEVIWQIAEDDPTILDDTALLVLRRAIRAFPSDPELVKRSLEALRSIGSVESAPSAASAVPPDALLALHAKHREEAAMAALLCDVLTLHAQPVQVQRQRCVQGRSAQASWMSMPLDVLACHRDDIHAVAAAAKAVRHLIGIDATESVCGCGLARLLVSGLAQHREDARTTCALLGALVSVAQAGAAECAELVEAAEGAPMLAQLLVNGASAAAGAWEPKAAGYACRALAAVAANVSPINRTRLREAVDKEALCRAVIKARAACPDLRIGGDFCERLVLEGKETIAAEASLAPEEGSAPEVAPPEVAPPTAAASEALTPRDSAGLLGLLGPLMGGEIGGRSLRPQPRQRAVEAGSSTARETHRREGSRGQRPNSGAEV